MRCLDLERAIAVRHQIAVAPRTARSRTYSVSAAEPTRGQGVDMKTRHVIPDARMRTMVQLIY
jgi:hypothetical protein